MKKITLKFFMIMFLLGTYVGVSQTLNQAASWPNTGWTITGTDAGETDTDIFESNPTVDATFAFDDDDAGGSSDNDIAAESPVIDLTAAHTAGETWLTVTSTYTHRYLANDELVIQYWDADGAAWVNWGAPFTTSTTAAPDNDYCSVAGVALTTDVLNIAAFTGTQLSGFKYRISYDDNPAGADWNYGFCFQSPTITSATPPTCPDPSVLGASNIDGFSADLSWTENGSATLWNIELVDITASGAQTMTATSTGVGNPFNITGLTSSNDYEYYVQSDCGGSTSTWVGPFAFSTTVACPDPSALTAINITTTSADLGWTDGGSETLWDVELGAQGFTATGTPTATGVTNPYNATTLTANTSYDFYVRADCNPNGTSNWVGPFTFTTACTTFTAPYTQDFENGGAAPACWSLGGDENWLFTNTGAGNHIGNNGTITGTSSSGGYFAYVDDSTPDATNAQLDSPFVDVSGLTTPSLSFFEISNNEGQASATLTVSVWDGAAWNVVGTYNSNTTAGGWEEILIDLSGLTFTGPAQARFSVADSGSFYDDIAIDDVVFDELPACIAPSAANVSNVMETSADIGWTENNGSMAWEIVVQAAGTGAPTGAGTATATNPYNANTLTHSTDYEAYVRTDCGGGTFSAWTGPISFTTLVPPPPTPPNDDCANAEVLTPSTTGAEVWVTGTTLGNTASGEVADTDISCTSIGAFGSGRDVWYSVEVPAAGDITITTQASAGSSLSDTIISVWSGTCGAMVGTEVDCDDDGGSGNFSEIVLTGQTAGDILYIRVQEFGAAASRMFGPQDGPFEIAAHAANPTLSTTSFDNELAFSYYPNPVNNTLTLNAQKEITNVAVFNMLGQEVIRTAPNAVSNEVNMSSLQAGAYFVQVTIGQVTETVRIIKN